MKIVEKKWEGVWWSGGNYKVVRVFGAEKGFREMWGRRGGVRLL